jgi:hypothetical protein
MGTSTIGLPLEETVCRDSHADFLILVGKLVRRREITSGCCLTSATHEDGEEREGEVKKRNEEEEK